VLHHVHAVAHVVKNGPTRGALNVSGVKDALNGGVKFVCHWGGVCLFHVPNIEHFFSCFQILAQKKEAPGVPEAPRLKKTNDSTT
jgi:hypothetical protein